LSTGPSDQGKDLRGNGKKAGNGRYLTNRSKDKIKKRKLFTCVKLQTPGRLSNTGRRKKRGKKRGESSVDLKREDQTAARGGETGGSKEKGRESPFFVGLGRGLPHHINLRGEISSKGVLLQRIKVWGGN